MLRGRALFIITIMVIVTTSIASASATNIFSKTLPDGTAVDVVQNVERQQKTPTKEDQEKLPEGFVAVGGEFEVLHYIAKYTNRKGGTVSIWEKTVESLVVPSGKGFGDRVMIRDVVMDSEQAYAAILYVQSSALRVDIVECHENGGKFQPAGSQTVFDLASRGTVMRAEMIQHEDLLYVFTVTSLAGSEIWCGGKDGMEKVYGKK
ncbi:MAG: hypothetical protein GXY61_05085 [Lentisphaerae bacterium]|nr:hypothetical protein [Lentisphaerota bacterium]